MAHKSAETNQTPFSQPVAPAESNPDAATGGTLQVSQTALRFHSTNPGQESYLILKVTPPAPDVAVSLSTDLPDTFQLAAGNDTLEFSPELTFTPQAKGTYVHLRYWPEHGGNHRAQLTVRANNETVLVALSGRTRGVRGLVAAPRQATLTQALRLGNRGARKLFGIVALALAYFGYQYRNQLLPLLRPSARQSSVEMAPAATTSPTPRPQLAATPATEPNRAKKKRATSVQSAVVASKAKGKPEGRKLAKKQAAPAGSPVEPPVTARQVPARTTERTAATVGKATQTPDLTPNPAAKRGADSELERILNHTEN